MIGSPEPHWFEGMLLLPQHLQLFSRYCQDRIGVAAGSVESSGWGIRALDVVLDEEGVVVRKIDATMRDGTWVHVPGNAKIRPGAIDPEVWARSSRLSVHLAVPKRRTDVGVVASATNPEGRFLLHDEECSDENLFPREATELLRVRILNAHLLIGDEDIDAYSTIKIGELVRKSGFDQAPELSDEFMPPLLHIGANDTLNAWMTEVITRLRDMKQAIGLDVGGLALAAMATEDGDPEAWLRLAATNRHHAVLSLLTAKPDLHPFDLHLALTQLVGELAIFGPGRTVEDLPAYNHADPGPGFRTLIDTAKRLIGQQWDQRWESHEFTMHADGTMTCSVDPAWLLEDEVFLALGNDVDADAEALPYDQLQQLISHVKLVSDTDRQVVEGQVLPGAALDALSETPKRMPELHGVQYIRIRHDPSSARWQSLSRSKVWTILVKGALPNGKQFAVFRSKRRKGAS